MTFSKKIRLFSVGLATLMIASPLAYAQTINDVAKSDGAYPAVLSAVRGGYLSVFKDGVFDANRPVSRKELAVVIDRIVNQAEPSAVLTKTDQQELTQLSKTFKNVLTDVDTRLRTQQDQLKLVLDEQKVLHHDISQTQDQFQQEIKGVREQQTYLWVGVGVAAFLAFLVK